MRRRIGFWLFLNLVLALASAVSNAQGMLAGIPPKPNVVFIVVDDLGWGDLKPYNSESLLDLPAIEGLAQEGMIFTDAHSPAAACAPSRYAIITGNYTWRGRDEWGTWRYYVQGSQVLSGQWTLGDVFQQAGYTTGIVGKYHLGGHVYRQTDGELASWDDDWSTLDFTRPLVDSAADHGFDFSFLNLLGLQLAPYAFFRNGYLHGNLSDIIFWESGQYGNSFIWTSGHGLSSWDTSEVQEQVLEQAEAFVRDSVSAVPSSPFFLYLPLVAIHEPHTPPPYLAGAPIQGTSGIGDKGDMVRTVDTVVGSLIQTLAEEGVLNETLIIFTSDNGALNPRYEVDAGHDGTGGLRGRKMTIFEGGHRVPLIVKWGDGTQEGSYINPGQVSEELISLQDMMATLSQIVGVDLPPDQANDSYNMISALFPTSAQVSNSRDGMLSLSDRDYDGLNLPVREYLYALRDGPWKLIVHFKQAEPTNTTALSLFNLDEDLAESIDLIDDPQHAGRVEGMLSAFNAIRASTRSAPLFELDWDQDGFVDADDNCPVVSNDQQDDDDDGIGNACDLLVASPGILPNGIMNIRYPYPHPEQALTASNGQPPFTWSLIDGSLPPGILLSTAGVLGGSPTETGTWNFTVQATDAAADTAKRDLLIMVETGRLFRGYHGPCGVCHSDVSF